MSRLTVDTVHDHVRRVCFKTGPPGQVGAETEWLVLSRHDPAEHVPIDRVRAAMASAEPLPSGSRVTYEPGGQLELSSLPAPGVQDACHALAADIARVKDHLERAGLCLSGSGVDPVRPPLLQLHTPRYRCMSGYFGVDGLPMMCSTASVQVCLDIGADEREATRRWRLAHALGPVLVAAFANSPVYAGRQTGLRSTRQAIWDALDHGRTRAPGSGDPRDAWASYALDAQVMAVREGDDWIVDPGMSLRDWIGGAGDRVPTETDLEYHLSTLFPPVRPQGWYELRMIDAPPERYWQVPVAVVAALLDDPAAFDLAADAAEPVTTRWAHAIRDALTDPPLARAARACFAAARAALPRLGADTALTDLVDEYTEHYVERGRCPADDTADDTADRPPSPVTPAHPAPATA